MVKHNNVIPNGHFHKDWQRRIKTWFDQVRRLQDPSLPAAAAAREHERENNWHRLEIESSRHSSSSHGIHSCKTKASATDSYSKAQQPRSGDQPQQKAPSSSLMRFYLDSTAKRHKQLCLPIRCCSLQQTHQQPQRSSQQQWHHALLLPQQTWPASTTAQLANQTAVQPANFSLASRASAAHQQTFASCTVS